MGLGLHRSPEYASRLTHQHIDTYGLDDHRLQQLRLKAEQDVGPSPPRSPEVRWRDFEPALKPFSERREGCSGLAVTDLDTQAVLPPDYRARSHLLNHPPPRIPQSEAERGVSGRWAAYGRAADSASDQASAAESRAHQPEAPCKLRSNASRASSALRPSLRDPTTPHLGLQTLGPRTGASPSWCVAMHTRSDPILTTSSSCSHC